MLKQYDQIKKGGVTFPRRSGVTFPRSQGVCFTRSNGVCLRGISTNPNGGSFTLTIKSNFHPDNSVEIFDLMGRKVFSKSFVSQTEALKLDVENGTYLMKYYDGIYSDSQVIIVNK